MNLYALLLYFLVAMNCPNGLHGPDCSACLILVVDCLFFTNLSPKMVANRCLQRAKSRPSGQTGRPAGRTPLPKRTGPVRAGFAVRDPTQTDRFRQLRTLKWVGPLEMP
jgi:hypothetical protein